MENPALGVEESSRCPICGFMTNGNSCPVCSASLKKTDDFDYEKSGGERLPGASVRAAAGQDDSFDLPNRGICG